MMQPSGRGTSTSDPYRITRPEELAYIQRAVSDNNRRPTYYILEANIDLSDNEWMPIQIDARDTSLGAIYFNGNGYVISGMICPANSTIGMGLFAGLPEGSQISNLFISSSLIDVSGFGSTGVGFLAGVAGNFCIFSNCGVVDSTISMHSGGAEGVGGLVGITGSGTDMDQCFTHDVTFEVESSVIVGGIAGEFIGQMDDCYARLKVCDSFQCRALGGLIGLTASGYLSAMGSVIINNSYVFFDVGNYYDQSSYNRIEVNDPGALIGQVVGDVTCTATDALYWSTYRYSQYLGGERLARGGGNFSSCNIIKLDGRTENSITNNYKGQSTWSGYGQTWTLNSSYVWMIPNNNGLPRLAKSVQTVDYRVSVDGGTSGGISVMVGKIKNRSTDPFDDMHDDIYDLRNGLYAPAIRGQAVDVMIQLPFSPIEFKSLTVTGMGSYTYQKVYTTCEQNNQLNYYVESVMIPGGPYPVTTINVMINIELEIPNKTLTFNWRLKNASSYSSRTISLNVGGKTATLSNTGSTYSVTSTDFTSSSVSCTVSFGSSGNIAMALTTSNSSTTAASTAEAVYSKTYTWNKASDTTVYIWVYQYYTVTFNAKGATSGSNFTRMKLQDVALSLPTNTFSKTGYDPNGWNTSSSGTGTHRDNGYSYTTNAATTFYAEWKEKVYTLKITFDSATSWSTAPTSVTVGVINGASSTISKGETWTTTLTHSAFTDIRGVTARTVSSGNTYYYVSFNSKPTIYMAQGYVSTTWETRTDLTLTLYVYQGYTVQFYAGREDGGVLPSSASVLHGDLYTMPENTMIHQGYNPNGWRENPMGYQGQHFNSGEKVTVEKNLALYSDWTPIYATVNLTVVTLDGSGKETTTAGGSVSATRRYDSNNYSYYGTATSSYTTLKEFESVITATANDGYLFIGFTTTKSPPTPTSSSMPANTYSITPTGNETYDIYVYFRRASQNRLMWTDEEGGYWYFEDGVFPQSEVTGSLVDTLNSQSFSSSDYSIYINNGSVIEIPVYTLYGQPFARVTINGVSKWFVVEAIRWRVSDYGTPETSYPKYFEEYFSTSNLYASSDKILFASIMTSEKIDDSKETDSNDFWLNDYVLNADFKLQYNTSGGNFYEYFKEAGSQKVVEYGARGTDKALVYSNKYISDGLSDQRAKLTAFASFLMYGTTAYADTYGTYWTKDLCFGSNDGNCAYGCGVAITSDGQKTLRWLNQMCGVRLSYCCGECSRY